MTTPARDPIAVDPTEAARLLGLPRRTFYDNVMPYVYDGTIKSAKLNRKRLIDYKSLVAWWNTQVAYTSGT